jgi:hypothetical protein
VARSTNTASVGEATPGVVATSYRDPTPERAAVAPSAECDNPAYDESVQAALSAAAGDATDATLSAIAEIARRRREAFILVLADIRSPF